VFPFVIDPSSGTRREITGSLSMHPIVNAAHLPPRRNHTHTRRTTRLAPTLSYEQTEAMTSGRETTVNGAAQDGGLEAGAMHVHLDRDGHRNDFDARREGESWQQ
jgi:hypothetical protein